MHFNQKWFQSTKFLELPGAFSPGPPSGFCPRPIRGITAPRPSQTPCWNRSPQTNSANSNMLQLFNINKKDMKDNGKSFYYLIWTCSSYSNLPLITIIYLFSTNVSLLQPLKTSENLRFPNVFRDYRSGTLVDNWLNVLHEENITCDENVQTKKSVSDRSSMSVMTPCKDSSEYRLLNPADFETSLSLRNT